MKRCNCFGFTFFEMLLVISITTSVTAAGIVGLSQLQAIFKIRSAADEIRSLMQLGRELAIANKNQANYNINLATGVVTLKAGQTEVGRFISPAGVIYQPNTLTWGFTPLTGVLTGCPLPCELRLTSTDNVEIITIQQSGIIK